MALLALQENNGEDSYIAFAVANYLDNNKLAIIMQYYDTDYHSLMPYANLTVNLVGEDCDENCAFVDTNNLGKEILNWIVYNNLGFPTGRLAKSGYCTYPEVKFNLDEVKRYDG